MKHFVFFLAASFLISITSYSQDNEAYKYLLTISKEQQQISKHFLTYASSVAHSKSARKVENRRKDLIKTVAKTKEKISAMSCIEGDCKLRDSLVSFLTINYYVLNNDYEKIVNMEEVAEQSYDLMEAYINARRQANDKVEKAGDVIDVLFREFARNHNITISDKKDEMSLQIEQINEVNKHHEAVYLIFFKAYKQEAYMLDALFKKDFSSAEQNRNALLQVAVECLGNLDTVSSYKGDKSLIAACKKVLEFYKIEARDKIGPMIDFMLKNENVGKLNKSIGAKKANMRTQEEIDEYNKAVDELNALSKDYNNTNNFLNQNRSNTLDNWNATSQNFLEKYIPKVK